MRFSFLVRALLLAMLVSSGSGFSSINAAEAASEQAIRAALIFNFVKFTEWPAAAGFRSLQVCVASGDSELFAALDALEERQVRGRPLAVVRFRQPGECDVIYADSRQRWLAMTDRPLPPHVLTLGNYEGFVADGGMIEIGLQDSRLRFEVNLAQARRAGLRFYPQLLQLARRVVE